MGRKKTYDRDELVRKAMELFRDHGFAGTSAQMLADGLGANRYSIWAEFGSKQGLFDEALARYDQEVVGRSFGPLEQPGAGVEEVRALLKFYGAAGKGPAMGRGCLLCNTAVELGPNDPSGDGFVQRYFTRLSGAFRAALKNERDAGTLREDVDVLAEADFFTSSVLGMFVMLRAKAPRKTIERSAQVALLHLDSLRAQ